MLDGGSSLYIYIYLVVSVANIKVSLSGLGLRQSNIKCGVSGLRAFYATERWPVPGRQQTDFPLRPGDDGLGVYKKAACDPGL